MTTRLTPDICVIGGGAGGFALALEAARRGASVVLVDKDAPGGGPVRHCAPMHALLETARHAQAMRRGSRFGIADAEPEIDFRKVGRHLREATAAAAPDRSAGRLAALGVHVVRGGARFVDRRTVTAGECGIRARNVVIATGARPVAPQLPGLDSVDFLTEDTVFALTRRPGRLVVIGGDPHALPLAQAFRRLGCEVTVVEAQAALREEDPEQAAIVLARLRAEGLGIREHTAVSRVERRGKTGVRLHVRDAAGVEGIIDGTHLLVLRDRVPAVEGLDLDRAGIAVSARGIETDARFRTANRYVHAIGDVTGGARSVHLAQHQAEIVARALLSRNRGEEGHAPVPRVIRTDPGIAALGLGEAEARQGQGGIRVLRSPYAENGRAQARREATGFVKLVTDRRKTVLGVSIMGEDAGEMIGLWALAMAKGLDTGDMAEQTPPFPSFGEIGKQAAISYFADATPQPGMRRILRFLRLSG